MSIFDRFLNTTGNSGAGFPIVDARNPLQWSRFAQTLITSLIAGVVVGVQFSVNAVVGAVTGLVGGATEWLFDPRIVFRFPGGYRVLEARTGLIPTIEAGALGLLNAVWQPFVGFGWLAYPLATAAALASFYPVVWSVRYVREEVI